MAVARCALKGLHRGADAGAGSRARGNRARRRRRPLRFGAGAGAQAVYDPYMAAAFCKAINDWIAAEWLSRDVRLRASIVVPMQAPDLALEEIERGAADDRFVSVLVLARRRSMIPTWPPPSARRSTTGSPPNGCRAM